jgi:hypothetical protein
MKAIAHNTARWLVLVWFTLWMGVIMPGHTRGAVRLPGAGEATACESCCCATACCETDRGDGNSETPADPARCCAVCYINATLNTPPPLTLYTPYLGQLDEVVYISCGGVAPHACGVPDPYRARPPPIG